MLLVVTKLTPPTVGIVFNVIAFEELIVIKLVNKLPIINLLFVS